MIEKYMKCKSNIFFCVFLQYDYDDDNKRRDNSTYSYCEFLLRYIFGFIESTIQEANSSRGNYVSRGRSV